MKSPVASLLWRSLRVYQVFGANTDVGKTIFTTLLARTAKKLWKDESVTFLKPVSTGAEDEADERYTPERHIARFAPGVDRSTLYQYDIPCSPHTAARASGRPVPSDDALLAKCRGFAARCAARDNKGWLFMETAGGVHSPGPSGKTQADLYIPLRAPSVLVGDARLGGISQTISAFESLRIRGYDVESVLLFREDTYENYRFLTDYFQENYGVPVSAVSVPPERQTQDAERDAAALEDYYSRKDAGEVAAQVLEQLHDRHISRLSDLDSLAHRASRHIWYPFTQQSLVGAADIMTIDSAHGDYFQTLLPHRDRSPLSSSSPSSPPPSSAAATTAETATSATVPVLQSSFDASASWWTQGLGHSNPKLTLAAAYAAGRYGHVMFASAVHQPAMSLAETLLAGMASPRLSRVFYSDNGSTGTEVAVKMGLRAARKRYGWDARQKLEILGLKGAYHGDTMGAMDCAEPGIFNEKIEWYQGKGHWLSFPTVLCKAGRWTVTGIDGGGGREDGAEFSSLADVFDVRAREAAGQHTPYEEYVRATLRGLQAAGRKFGALMLEPIVLGSGGMQLVDPLFQRTLVNVVRASPHLFADKRTQQPPPPSQPETTDEQEWTGLPVIFDEVFTGLYRLGRFTPSSFLHTHPDISVHAKLLTGGLVPLCATLASESIFNTFLSPDKTDALLHGHSYTAHPIGCQVALESVREMQSMEARGEWDWAIQRGGWLNDDEQLRKQEGARGQAQGVWSVWPRGFVEDLSRVTDRVEGAWALGSVLAIHLQDKAGSGGYSSNAALGLRDALSAGRQSGHFDDGGPWNVHSRVLGNVLYVMASQVTSETSIRQLCELLLENIQGK